MIKVSLRYLSHKYLCNVKLSSVILSLTLSALILFNSMQVSLTFAYYKIDPIGFIERLCENLDKPELECNGKCQLKKIAETNSTNNKNVPNVIDFKEILLYKESSNNYFLVKNVEKVFQNYSYQNFYNYLKFSDCFHPPQKSFSYLYV